MVNSITTHNNFIRESKPRTAQVDATRTAQSVTDEPFLVSKNSMIHGSIIKFGGGVVAGVLELDALKDLLGLGYLSVA